MLREAAADALRTIVAERTLRQRRERAAHKRRYDDGSVSSLEEEPANAPSVGEEVAVTQADVDAAYALAERVGRKWADCLREEEGLPASADAVLEVLQAGRYLEAEPQVEESSKAAQENGTGNGERSVDAVADEAVAAAQAPIAEELKESTPAHESESMTSVLLSNLANPADAITPEVAISRLVTPPSLLIGTNPSFGALAGEIPPNMVLSASLTTMLPTSQETIRARTKEADAWRRHVADQMGQIIENQRWLYPKSLLEMTVRHNRERMASSRVGASTTASIASGRAVAATDKGKNDDGPGRKRRRKKIDIERANDAGNKVPVVQSRPPCPYSELEWTGCELSQEQRRKLDEELLHEIPEAADGGGGDDGNGGDGERIRVSPQPTPPSCIVGGHLQHVGSIQQWEKAGARGIQVEESDDPMKNLQQAKTRRKRWYRQAKTERLGRRAERPNDARIEINARLSKVVKATDGEKQQEEEADEAPEEYLEMDLGGCLLEVGTGDDGAQTIVTFKSLELSLALNAEGVV